MNSRLKLAAAMVAVCALTCPAGMCRAQTAAGSSQAGTSGTESAPVTTPGAQGRARFGAASHWGAGANSFTQGPKQWVADTQGFAAKDAGSWKAGGNSFGQGSAQPGGVWVAGPGPLQAPASAGALSAAAPSARAAMGLPAPMGLRSSPAFVSAPGGRNSGRLSTGSASGKPAAEHGSGLSRPGIKRGRASSQRASGARRTHSPRRRPKPATSQFGNGIGTENFGTGLSGTDSGQSGLAPDNYLGLNGPGSQ